ncbi:MAG: YdeI/OmpD-associated family protein [Saprospiraceae bacterium]|nr:YdeI/OmpD-associated family protein [Saprospiraceae bacterium]
MTHPIVDKDFLVEKRIAKSGFKFSNWTHVVLSDFPMDVPRKKGGTVKVKGFIDCCEIKQYNLLPMQGNNMLLPLKSSIRKKIKKEVGEYVHVRLFLDDSSLEIPEELLVCLADSRLAQDFFMTLTESNQKYYVDWILASKSMETKVARIVKTIQRLEQGQKFYDWPL